MFCPPPPKGCSRAEAPVAGSESNPMAPEGHIAANRTGERNHREHRGGTETTERSREEGAAVEDSRIMRERDRGHRRMFRLDPSFSCFSLCAPTHLFILRRY